MSPSLADLILMTLYVSISLGVTKRLSLQRRKQIHAVKKSRVSMDDHRRPSCQVERSSLTNQDAKAIEIAVLGASEVGKTSLVNQFTHHQVPAKYRPTVENFYWIEYEVNQSQLMLNIIDASGSHDFYAMRDLYVRQADAFLLVFAINDPKSFDEVVRLREQIQSNNLKNAPVIIVANKIDIETEFRQVLLNSAAEFSGTHDTLLAECYVDDYKSVLDVFSRLMKQLPAVDGNLDLIKRRRQSMPNVHLTAEANKKCKRKRKCLIS